MFVKEYIKYFKKAIPLGLIIGQILIFLKLMQSNSIDMKTVFLYDFVPTISLGYLFGCEYICSMESWSLKRKTLIQTILLVPLYFIYIKIGLIEWRVLLIGNILWIILVLIKDILRRKKDKQDAAELNELLKKWNE